MRDGQRPASICALKFRAALRPAVSVISMVVRGCTGAHFSFGWLSTAVNSGADFIIVFEHDIGAHATASIGSAMRSRLSTAQAPEPAKED